MAAQPLMRIENLVKHFHVRLGAFGERAATVHALDDVNFDIFEGETLSLVGESGCGKSTTGFTLLNLHRATEGKVIYQGKNIVELDEKAMRPYRRQLQIVFQDPYSTLNPRMTIGEAVGEPILFHKLATKAELKDRIATLLADVGLPPRFASRYPHELSGGQRQRVAIARALACQPKFIVCDEAISALDVSVQAQIINLLLDLQQKYGLTYLFIAHDLAVVRHISDRVGVMYLGRLAELATKAELKDRIATLLADVGLPPRFASRYPHELSGGQRQRVAIARALACQPKFIVCDEAISALDVSVQAQIINLLLDLQQKYGLTYLFIAHDLAVVRHISDRVGVMYLGRLAELATREELFEHPLHPYTKALLSAVPEADPAHERSRKRQILQGDVPSPRSPPAGCRFHTRCPIAMEVCGKVVPEWREARPGHMVACHAVTEGLPG